MFLALCLTLIRSWFIVKVALFFRVKTSHRYTDIYLFIYIFIMLCYVLSLVEYLLYGNQNEKDFILI